jgi:hypothetical protein
MFAMCACPCPHTPTLSPSTSSHLTFNPHLMPRPTRLAGTLGRMGKFEEGEPIGERAVSTAHEFYGEDSVVGEGVSKAYTKDVGIGTSYGRDRHQF